MCASTIYCRRSSIKVSAALPICTESSSSRPEGSRDSREERCPRHSASHRTRRGDARDSGGLPCVLQAPAFAMRACRIANSSRFCAGGSRNCCTTYMVPTLASVRQCPHGPACRRRRTSVPPRTPPTTQCVTPRVEGSGFTCRIPPPPVPAMTPSRQQANPDGGNRQRRLFLLLPLPAWASRASIRGRRLGPP